MRCLRTCSLGALIAVAAAGCGGSSSPVAIPNSSSMALISQPITCQVAGSPLGTESESSLFISILANESIADVCATLADPCNAYANLTEVVLLIQNFDAMGGTADDVGPGTYQLTQNVNGLVGTFADAGVIQTNGSCTQTSPTSEGTSTGTITIGDIGPSEVTGSFDVTVQGTEYTGSFGAALCSTSSYPITCGGIETGTCTGTPQCL